MPASPTITTLSFPPLIVGDKWVSPLIDMRKEGFDFTGQSVTAKLRRKTPSGEVVHEFTVSPVVVALGAMSIVLSLSSAESLAIGIGHYIGDVVCATVNDGGPITPFRFKLQIEARITT